MLSTVLTLVVAVFGVEAAHAAGTLTVTPSTGLSDGQLVTYTLDGFTPNPFASVTVAQCGNAYANGDPLPEVLDVVQGELDQVNCEAVAFIPEGSVTEAPLDIDGLLITARQTGIGTGNRTCMPAPPALEPCFAYVSTSVNMTETAFNVQQLFFSSEPALVEPAETVTTMSAIGSPVSSGKTARMRVVVTSGDPTFKPEGSVEVYEGLTLRGTGTLDSQGTVHVSVGALAQTDHELHAVFTGNGSFAGSTSASTTLSVIDPKNITIGDATIIEGDTTNTRVMAFPVVVPQSGSGLTVSYAIVGSGANPAEVPADVKPAHPTAPTKLLTFKPLATVKYIVVKIVGDTEAEGDQTFSVVLSNPSNGYVLRKGIGAGTIIDDDAAPRANPTIDIGSSVVPEGDAGGARALKFALSLSKPAATTVSVQVQTSNMTAIRGTQSGGGDYGGAVNKTVLFKPGITSKYVAVPAYPDTLSNLDLTLKVKILSVGGADLGSHNEVVGTILSDE